MDIYIPKTNIISFTHKSGKLTQLTTTAVQKFATMVITSVHKGTIMIAINVFLSPFLLLMWGRAVV
jgi:hypothetical protein